MHRNPGGGIPSPTWNGVTQPLGGTPRELIVSNIDGDANRLPDLLALVPDAAQPLVLHVRRSTALGDLEATPIAGPTVFPDGG